MTREKTCEFCGKQIAMRWRKPWGSFWICGDCKAKEARAEVDWLFFVLGWSQLEVTKAEENDAQEKA